MLICRTWDGVEGGWVGWERHWLVGRGVCEIGRTPFGVSR